MIIEVSVNLQRFGQLIESLSDDLQAIANKKIDRLLFFLYKNRSYLRVIFITLIFKYSIECIEIFDAAERFSAN